MTSSSNIGVTRFSIDSSLELPADGYQAELDNCFCFINANFDTDIVELEAGFIDPNNQAGPPQSVKHLTGNIDEYILDVSPDRIVGRLRGRDKVHELLDRPFRKLFLRNQPEEDPGVPFQVGNFLASEIATEVVQAAGLNLQFQMRDYELFEDFEAFGRSLDILTRLAEPFSQVDMFRVDIFVQDNTVFMRPRQGTGLTADFTFTATDARIRRMTIRKKETPKWGTVTLLGRFRPVNLDVQQVGGLTIIQAGTQEEITTKENFDNAGNLVTRVVETTTLRMPDRIPEQIVEQEFQVSGFGLTLIRQVNTFNEYQSSVYDIRGALNQPLLERQCIETSGILEDDPTGTFQLIRRDDTFLGYDEFGFQTIVTRKKFELNVTSGQLEEVERQVETLRELDFLKTEKVTAFYETVEETVVLNPDDPPAEQQSLTSAKLQLVRQETNINAGIRPGGTRPPRTIGLSGTPGGDDASKEQIKLEETISTAFDAQDVRFSNENMDEDDLEFIMNQFRISSGLIEYEIQIDYVAMAWLRKGSVLEITNLFCEDGITPIPLDPALIFEQRLRYDESSATPALVATIRSVFWRAS